jgi:hypothetical protein
LQLGLYDPRTEQRLQATPPTGERMDVVQVPLE